MFFYFSTYCFIGEFIVARFIRVTLEVWADYSFVSDSNLKGL